MSGLRQTPWLQVRSREHGESAAIRFRDETFTWKQLAAQTEELAARLDAAGVVRGDLVATRMVAHPRFVALFHALQLLGAAMLPLNLRLTNEERHRALEHARPKLFLHDADLSDNDVPTSVRPLSFEELVASTAKRSFSPPSSIDPDAALTVVYTSGSTAAPKGVILTNANYAASAAASRQRLGHGASDVWLATLPLFHIGGLAILARAALEGSSLLLEDNFDSERLAAVLQSGESTMVSVVPTMLGRALERMASRGSPALRAVLVGGAALSPTLGHRALDAGLPVSATYGMTEACSQICSSAPGSSDAASALVGPPLQGVEVRILDPDGEGWGEISVRGKNVTRGYLSNDSADAAAFAGKPRDWFSTGDLGRLHSGGSLELAGRRDDLIVTGGENVVPLEVERTLDAHPSVAESLVVGSDDAEWGQRVVALVVARDGTSPSADELTVWCRGRIAAYKSPREIRFVAKLPRGSTGKVLRRLPR